MKFPYHASINVTCYFNQIISTDMMQDFVWLLNKDRQVAKML